MCLSPIYVENPYYKYPFLDSHPEYRLAFDTVSSHIQVPCGNCSVCLHLKQIYITQRVQMEALNHDLYFLTLTYNNESLPSATFGEFTFSYVDLSDWQSMIKMIRKYESLPDFRYMLVTEYGGKRHRPHLHAILSFPKSKSDTLADRLSFEIKLHSVFLKYWRRNINYLDGKFTKAGKRKVNTRDPVWLPLCTYVRNARKSNYDLHYLNPSSTTKGLSDVAFYVSKYCLKFDKWLDKFKSKLYFNLSDVDFPKAWELLRPRRLLSKGFGSPNDPDVVSHIDKGIDLAVSHSDALFPYFINPVDGSTSPLCPYYAKRRMTFQDKIFFRSRLNPDEDGFVSLEDRYSLNDILVKESRLEKIQDLLDSSHTYFDDDADNTNDFTVINYEKIVPFSADVFNFDDFECSATTDTPSHADA